MSELTDIQRKKLEQIKAMIAKAKSTDSEEEAKTFMAAANKLLRKYNLTQDDVERSEIHTMSYCIEYGHNADHWGDWEEFLANVCCTYNHCGVVYHKQKGAKSGHFFMSIVGDQVAGETSRYMFETLREIALRELKDTWDRMQGRMHMVEGSSTSSTSSAFSMFGGMNVVSLKMYNESDYPKFARTFLHHFVMGFNTQMLTDLQREEAKNREEARAKGYGDNDSNLPMHLKSPVTILKERNDEILKHIEQDDGVEREELNHHQRHVDEDGSDPIAAMEGVQKGLKATAAKGMDRGNYHVESKDEKE